MPTTYSLNAFLNTLFLSERWFLQFVGQNEGTLDKVSSYQDPYKEGSQYLATADTVEKLEK